VQVLKQQVQVQVFKLQVQVNVQVLIIQVRVLKNMESLTLSPSLDSSHKSASRWYIGVGKVDNFTRIAVSPVSN